jgi:hypothetical protein
MTTTPPFHQQQILRSVPAWCKSVHPTYLPALMGSLRQDFLQGDGTPHDWFRHATPEQQQALREAIEKRDASREAVRQLLLPLKGVTDFCKPLLQQHLGIKAAVDQAQYHLRPFRLKRDVLVGPTAGIAAIASTDHYEVDPDGKPRILSLLAAALHNFTQAEEPDPFSSLHVSSDDPQAIEGLTASEFVRACRTLDLGRQYQTHVANLYDGPDSARIHTQSTQASRDELWVQALIAQMRGLLSATGVETLRQLCTSGTTAQYGAQAMQCWRIELFDTPLNEVLLIATDANAQTTPCIAYIPGAPDAPVREYPSPAQAAVDLARRLQQQDLLRTVTRLAPAALQAQLGNKLREALFEEKKLFGRKHVFNRKHPRLRYQTHLLPSQPWDALHRAHVRRLKGDAATLAVPTATVDAEARLQRLEHLLSAGLDVLNVAAMFIPLLNPLMMVIGAAQIMSSVFQGIEAWEDDQRAEALAQVESLLVNLATVAGVAGGVALFKASGFVDAMRSIKVAGQERLWHADLSTYASDVELPDDLRPNALGQYHHNDKTYVRLGNDLYAHSQDNEGIWRIDHPGDPQAYRPALEHNGSGAWRTVHEQPLDWDDAELVRRFGPISEPLDDQQLLAVLRCTGTAAETLRAAHVAGEPPPPLLADALMRLRADQEADEIITRVRHGMPLAAYRNYALPALPELPGWPQDHFIKAFEGPEPWGTSVRYGPAEAPGQVEIQITRADLEQGRLGDSVMRQMEPASARQLFATDTNAREGASGLRERLATYLTLQRTALSESLYASRAPSLGEPAQALGRQFSGLPPSALEALAEQANGRERQLMVSGRIPLRVAEEARLLQARFRLDRALLGLYRPGLSNADSLRLGNALHLEHPQAQPARLLEIALGDRAHAAQLIGQQPIKRGFRSPLRLSDGRVGYQLSGRSRLSKWLSGEARAIEDRRLQELYPALSSSARRQLLTRLRARGDVGQQIEALTQEQRQLASTLQQWLDLADDDAYDDRRRLYRILMSAWRQDRGEVLILEELTLESLPELPARFDHITALSLRSIGLRALPERFLQSFPALRQLDLVGNTELPAQDLWRALRSAPRLQQLGVAETVLGGLDDAARSALAGLPELHILWLHDTELTLLDADLEVLSRLPLERLHLHGNAITLDIVTAERFAAMPRLRELRLSNNPLQVPPALASLHRLETLMLDDCQLGAWPAGLTELMSRRNCTLRNLDLSSNQIHDVPLVTQVLDSTYARELSARRRPMAWNFHYNGLQPDTAVQLRSIGARIIEVAHLPPPEQAVDWLASASATQRQQWNDLFEGNAHAHLREVIERVGRSAEARNNQQSLARQIWQMLDTASKDSALRQHLDEVASDFPATCGDAGTDAFSTLEVELLIHEHSQEADVPGAIQYNFYTRLFRREQVNRLAARIHAARLERQQAFVAWETQAPEERPDYAELPPFDPLDDITLEQLRDGGLDDIEIRLALRQSLARVLVFPEPSQDMLYRQTARITQDVIDNVEHAVRDLEDDDEAVRVWISRQPSWQRFLRSRYGERFEQLQSHWSVGLEYLDYCLDEQAERIDSVQADVLQQLQDTLPMPLTNETGQLQRVQLDSQQYRQATDALAKGRQVAEEALLLALTTEQAPNRPAQ